MTKWAALGIFALVWVIGCVLVLTNPKPYMEIGCKSPLSAATIEHLARCDHGSVVTTSSADLVNGHHPVFLIDGRIGGEIEKWVSSKSDEAPLLTVTLAAPVKIGRIVLHHAGVREPAKYNTDTFSIEVGIGGKFQEVARVTNNRANVTSHLFAPMKADAVRIRFLKTTDNADNQARLYEIEIYAS